MRDGLLALIFLFSAVSCNARSDISCAYDGSSSRFFASVLAAAPKSYFLETLTVAMTSVTYLSCSFHGGI